MHCGNFTTMWPSSSYEIEEYKPPKWAEGFKIVPKYRLKLAMTPTPIKAWNLPGLPDGIEMFIKRDDMTGSTLTGNKVRKLEFFLADAIKRGYKNVITIGLTQSNHVRSTVLAAREVGLESHVLFRAYDENIEALQTGGNALLTLLSGAHVYGFVDKTTWTVENFNHLDKIMKKLAGEIKETTGEDSYIIPVGAAGPLGEYGYFEQYDEMLQQGLADNITDIVVKCGSGGSMAAIAIANHIVLGDKIRVHGLCKGDVLDSSYYYNFVDKTLQEFGLTDINAKDIVNMIEYHGSAFGPNTEDEIDFIFQTSSKTGIVLDCDFTGRGAYTMVQELHNNPSQFKGTRILFIHTGGIYANLSQEMSAALKESSDFTSKWKIWDHK